MRIVIALALLLVAIVRCQREPEGPVISTENGNLQITSPGSIAFQAGRGGQIQFMSAEGEEVAVGEKGQKGDGGDRGDMGLQGLPGNDGRDGVDGSMGVVGLPGATGVQGVPGIKGQKGEVGSVGPEGQQGLRGVAATDSTLVTWNECVWQNLNSGLDYGLIATCHLNKARNDTWVRITWGGNMRITRCETCCMRWYFTINGEECVDPGPIDMVKFQGDNYHLLRHSTLSGTCRATGGNGLTSEILDGPIRVQFLIMDCPGFNGGVFDAYTGWNSVSRITVEEITPRDPTFPEVAVTPPPDEFIYTPHYCQYFYPHLGGNRERNVGTLASIKFFKEHPFTVLRITWEGNLLKRSCTNCCAQWRIEIDGEQCTQFEDITTSITSSTAQDIFAPTTISGFCSRAGIIPILDGNHLIRLVVQGCGNQFFNTAGGFFSSSRLIVEELPLSRDPQVNPGFYHPQWMHCTFPSTSFGGQNEGPFPDASCSFNKTTDDSSVRVTFNGNLRLFSCGDCCMRWFVTLNGEECVSPAPIEAVIAADNVAIFSIHRGSTITGICDATATGTLTAGPITAILNVGACDGFNNTLFDAFTGASVVSAFTLEELPATLDPAPEDRYTPLWTHCVSDEPLNEFRNISDNSTNDDPIHTCPFTKQSSDTALRVAWDGNIALNDCNDCCMRWFLTLNGEECSDPGPIDVALSQSLGGGVAYDLTRPASIVGICNTYGNITMPAGEYEVELRVAACEVTDENNPTAVPDPGNTTTGFNSVSRFIVEEIPKSGEDCVV